MQISSPPAPMTISPITLHGHDVTSGYILLCTPVLGKNV